MHTVITHPSTTTGLKSGYVELHVATGFKWRQRYLRVLVHCDTGYCVRDIRVIARA